MLLHYHCIGLPSFWKLHWLRVPPKEQITVYCSGWGYRYRPIQDGSHINAKHIWSSSQSSYAVDVHMLDMLLNAVYVHMDVLFLHYHCSCLTSFWKVTLILGTSQGANHRVVWWLRLQTPTWFSHQYQTRNRCFTNFICCGCAHGSVDTTLLLLSFTNIFGSYLELWVPPKRSKSQSSSVIAPSRLFPFLSSCWF